MCDRITLDSLLINPTRPKEDMKIFSLNETLKSQGHELNLFQRRAISELLIIDDNETLHVNSAKHMYHKQALKNLKTGVFHKADYQNYLNSHDGWQKISLPQLKKVIYRPTVHGMITTWGSEDLLKLYRAVHIDTNAAASIHPAWLIDEQVMNLIGKYLVAPGVRSDLENSDGFVIPRLREYGYLVNNREDHPDRKLPYRAEREMIPLHPNYLLDWDEQKKTWEPWDAFKNQPPET